MKRVFDWHRALAIGLAMSIPGSASASLSPSPSPSKGDPLDTEPTAEGPEPSPDPGPSPDPDPNPDPDPSPDPEGTPDEATVTTTEPPPRGEPPVTAPARPDELRLHDGTVLRGQIVEIHEGAYVTLEIDETRTSTPWSEIDEISLVHGRSEPVLLQTARDGLARPTEPGAGHPLIEVASDGERPMALLSLRGTKVRGTSRYRAGFNVECRAPCGEPIPGEGRTFFLDADPWASSKLFTLPPTAEHIRIDVKPGNPDMRKAGVAFLALSAAGLSLGLTLLIASAPERRVLQGIGLTWASLSPAFLITGGVLFGLGRTRFELAPMTLDGKPAGTVTTERTKKRKRQRPH